MQIEWHCSRSRETFAVLGFPKENFVDNGQARPQGGSVQEGSEEKWPYSSSLSIQRFGAELDANVQPRPDILSSRLYLIAIYTPTG